MKKHRLIVLLISVAAAILFWLYVVTTIAPETTGSINGIPVSVIGDTTLEERGLMITDFGTSEVRVELETSRAALSKLNSNNVIASVDVSRITEPGEYDMSYTITFPNTVNSGDIVILRKSVDRIHIEVEEIATKTLTIEPLPDPDKTVAEDYYIYEDSNVRFNPETVTLKGPADEIEKIAQAAVYFDLSQMDDLTIFDAKILYLDAENNELALSSFVTASVSEVQATVPISWRKELTLAVNPIFGPGIGENDVTITLSTEKIRVSGSKSIVQELPEEWLLGDLDVTKMEDGEGKEFQLTLEPGLTEMDGVTSVTATVSFKNLTEKEFSVSGDRITFENIPEELTIADYQKSVTVKLRGRSDVIRTITEEDIHVYVDLSKVLQSGGRTLEATVKIDGDRDVACGKVSVYVQLVEKE